MFFKSLCIWWLRRRIARRTAHIKELKQYLATSATNDGDISLYILDLRDRIRLDECRIASINLHERIS